MAYRTPTQALAWCSKHPTYSGKAGYCQKEARTAYLVNSDGTPTAAADWFGSEYKHPLPAIYTARNFEDVPKGALLRWTGGGLGAGHVALYAGLKGGVPMMWSTDLRAGAYVPNARALVRVDLAQRLWGLRFVGWTEDIDGVRVVSPVTKPEPKPPVKTKPSPTPLPPAIHAAPTRSVFHDDTRIKTAGGVVSDSRVAAALAARKHYHWIDSDVRLTHRNRAGLKMGTHDPNLVPVNGHGAPYNPSYLKGRQYEDVSLDTVPGMYLFSTAVKRNAAHGLATEAEVKDIHPYHSDENLHRLMLDLRAAAVAAYGKGWRRSFNVKVLTDLSGGVEYALRVAEAAHAVGIPTMILVRGKWRYTRLPARANQFVTYVRGARKGLYPAA